MDLAVYRRSAEAFVSGLTGAFYRHYAGLEDDYAIEPIYERHAALFTEQAVAHLQDRADRSPPGSEEQRRAAFLLDFAVEGFVGQRTKELEAQLARREAELSIQVEGRAIAFRQSTVEQANEPDPARREAIEHARLAATAEHLDALHREMLERRQAAAARLGYSSYRAMCAHVKGIDLVGLQAQTDAFATATALRYRELLEAQLERTLGIGLSALHRSDLPRFFRAPEQDPIFPAGALVPSLVETLEGLGLGGRAGVILDTEPRRHKSPRAFCAPVRVPDEVYLVIAPVGGRDDFSALFHEAGHAHHYAHVAREHPFEFRHLGDNSITEAFAFLIQHLVEDPLWLERRLGVADPGPAVAYARAHRLLYLRRYTAKLAYEMELHGDTATLEAMPARYAELLGEALQIPWAEETFLADVDPGFYSACYLRAWALEAQLRGALRERFGPLWFESPEAGEMLRTLWSEGQRRSPDELLASFGDAPLDVRVLLSDPDLS